MRVWIALTLLAVLGTPVGLQAVDIAPFKDLHPTGDSNPANFVVANNLLFFTAFEPATGPELWRSDGTVGGTFPLDWISGTGGINPSNLTKVGNLLFFAATDGTNGQELWRSDGTLAGTFMVLDINSGPTGSNPTIMVDVNNILFFQANNGVNGQELWKSDGTLGNATLVKDIDTLGSSSPNWLTNVNGVLFFAASDGTNGMELWRSDGTADNTFMVANINTTFVGASSGPNQLFNFNGILLFSATDGTIGQELWRCNPADNSTELIMNIYPGGPDSSPAFFTQIGGTVFFSARDDTNGRELWMTDGTVGNAQLVRNINPLGADSSPADLVNLNGVLFFGAVDGTGLELWKSDGTEAGTVQVLDLTSGPTGSSILNLLAVPGKNQVIFSAHTTVEGTEPFKSDGTALGTLVAADIVGGSGNSNPGPFVLYNSKVFFAATTTTYGRELYALSLNRDPSDLALAPASVSENRAIGTVVGTLSTTDPDSGDTVFTYTLVAGTGSDDNASFTIAGNQVLTGAVFNFEVKSSYTIRVRSTDPDGGSFEEAFTITITNVSEAAKSDFSGEGQADILFRHPSSGDVVLWIMNGVASASQE